MKRKKLPTTATAEYRAFESDISRTVGKLARQGKHAYISAERAVLVDRKIREILSKNSIPQPLR